MDYRTKPSSPEALLEHYGAKGMKWGVRKERVTGKQILGARNRQAARAAASRRAPKGSRAANAAKKDFLTNEDRVTASRMTVGEKWAVSFIGGPLGLAYAATNSSRVRGTAARVDAARARR